MSSKKKNINTNLLPNWISYENKEDLSISMLDDINKITANDLNSIKWTVMNGIPLFWEGQTIMFSNFEKMNIFLVKFNLAIHVDYSFIESESPVYLVNNKTATQEREAYGSPTIMVNARNLPATKLYLKNENRSSDDGQIVFHRGSGGEATGLFPVISGFWGSSPTRCNNRYYIQMNNESAHKGIDNNPLGVSIVILTFNREIYASDIKK